MLAAYIFYRFLLQVADKSYKIVLYQKNEIRGDYMKEDSFEWKKLLEEAEAAGITIEEIRSWMKMIEIIRKQKTPKSHAGLGADFV